MITIERSRTFTMGLVGGYEGINSAVDRQFNLQLLFFNHKDECKYKASNFSVLFAAMITRDFFLVVCDHSRFGCLIKRSHCRKVCFPSIDQTIFDWTIVALSSSYLVIVPKLLKVGYDNQLSVFIAATSQPVQVKFELTVGQQRIQSTATVTAGKSFRRKIRLSNRTFRCNSPSHIDPSKGIPCWRW